MLTTVGQSAATVAIWIAVLVLPVALALLTLLVVGGLVAQVLDPCRRRLLPFTVARPVSLGPTGWKMARRQAPPPLPPSQQPGTDSSGRSGRERDRHRNDGWPPLRGRPGYPRLAVFRSTSWTASRRRLSVSESIASGSR